MRVVMPDNMYGSRRGYDLRDDAWYVDEFDPSNMLGVALFGDEEVESVLGGRRLRSIRQPPPVL